MISNSADTLFIDTTYCRCILETLLKWQPCQVEFENVYNNQENILTWDGAKLEQTLDKLKNQQFSRL